MPKKLSKVSDLIDFQLENGIVMVDKGLYEELFVKIINGTESFSKEPKEVLINSFHHTALNDHIDKFMFVSLGNVHFEQFVGALLEVDSGLNDQVNCPSEVDQVLLS